MNDSRLLAYFGHHRCASSWVKSILTDVCAELNLVPHTHNVGRLRDDLLPTLEANHVGFVFCTNASRALAKAIAFDRGFHVVRDPRDVVVSSYFSHRNSHRLGGWLTEEYRDDLKRLSEEEGILLEMAQRVHQFRSMIEWDYQDPAVLELRMEDMIAEPYREFSRVGEFLGIVGEATAPGTLRPSRLAEILEKHSFQAKAGRQPGEEDVNSHYRKGVHGDWANHFTPAHRQYFKNHYNDLLLKLGYEENPDW